MEIRLLTEADTPSYHPLRLRALREEPEAFGAAYEERVLRPVAETAERLRPLRRPRASRWARSWRASGWLGW